MDDSNTIGRMHELLWSRSREFCVEVLSRTDLQVLAKEALAKCKRLRQRKSPLQPMLVLWLVLSMTLFRAKSIPNVLVTLLAALRGVLPALSLKPVTDGALAYARHRLGVAPLVELFRRMGERIDPRPSFHGSRVWLIDGVCMTMPDTPQNDQAFGRPVASRGSSAFPQLSMVALVDATTRMFRAVSVKPIRFMAAEQRRAVGLLKHLGAGDLLALDRRYYSAWFLHELLERGIQFIVRVPANAKPKIVRRFGKGDYLVKIQARIPMPLGELYKPARGPACTTRPITLTLRMIEYHLPGHETVRLITSLTDPEAVPARDIALGYHQRWEVELAYDETKVHLATVRHGTLHTVFRCKSPRLVMQEVYAMLITYNAVREVMAVAGERHRINPLYISFVDTVQVLVNSLPELKRAPAGQLPILHDRLLRDIADCRLDRPRRPRRYVRGVKIKMSKYTLKRPKHVQEIIHYQRELILGASNAA